MNKDSLSIFMHPYIYYQGKYGGIARYVCELAEELCRQGHTISLPIRDVESIYLHNSDFFAKLPDLLPSPSCVDLVIAKILNKLNLGVKSARYLKRAVALKTLKQGKFDIIHPSYTNSTEILPHVGKTPLVVTVHDMIHELYPQSFCPTDPTSERKRKFSLRADRIIAISQQTKADLIHHFGISEEKIDVIYHGNSLVLPANYQEFKMDIPERYILFVGHRFGYKNFDSVLSAFAGLAESDESIYLVCAGGPAFSDEELHKIKTLNIQQRVTHRCVSDDELAILYNRCLLFVYPSLYEGFGLPILEAFACNAPVLCARASCFPEIASTGAAYFTPGNDDELAHTMLRFINSTEEREKYRALGRSRLQEFTWAQCAAKTLSTYRKAIDCCS